MELNKIIIFSGLALSGLLSLSSFAESHDNSAVRWVIDTNGLAYKNKQDSFDGWFSQALPYAQKAIAITGSYFHYHPGGPDIGLGYAYDEYSSFVVSDSGNTYRDSQKGWQQMNGCWQAKDVSSYTLEHAYCVNGDGSLKKYDVKSNSFEGYITIENEQISRIDVASQGEVWAITDSHKIFRLNNSIWTEIKTGCEDSCWPINIAVGGDQVYVVNQFSIGDGGMGDTALFTLKENALEFYGNYIEADIDRDNNFWGITSWQLKLLYKKPGMKQAVPYRSFPYRLTASVIGG